MRVAGLMSGTSLDGIDVALVDVVPRGERYAVDVVRFATVAHAPALRARLRAALPPNDATLATLAALDRELGVAFAQAARAVVGAERVDLVATHGQTMYHDGARRLTLQAGDPYVLRDALGATVAFDFRRADCAAGGQGAPLVPYVDALLLASAGEARVALNLGGIANLTVLPAGAKPADAVAFDSGPGVMLLDAFVAARTGGTQTFDRDGRFAAAGTVDEALLGAMLTDPYFAMRPPKSTGRERFGEHFLAAWPALASCSLEDGAATLAALTARSVAAAIRAHGTRPARTIVSGGGARNPALLAALRAELDGIPVEPSDVHGIDADAKEAIAFAVLGYETLRERAAGLPRVTGAARAAVLGALVPHGLAAAVAKVAREVAAAGEGR